MKITIEVGGASVEFQLTDETAAALQAIADRSGVSLETALQQAITNENFLEVQQANGAKLLVEQNGTIREAVRKAQPA
jgi:predicted transcriptional regulator